MRQKTLLKIMGLFRKNMDLGMTILEISKKLGIGYRPAYNHIAEMDSQGMITIKKVGKAKQCFLNLKNEKTRHVLQEVDILKKEELQKKDQKLKNVLESLTSRLTEKFISEIHSIVLFGSHARERATKSSDIDLIFIVSDMKNKELREGIESECANFRHSHNLTVSPIITDINEFRKMLKAEGLNIGKEIREYGISIYGSEKFWRLIA